MKKAVKFGGSSLASAEQFQKVKQIIQADASRRYVIPSAPGKRDRQDTKVTDLLYACYDRIAAAQDASDLEEKICARYQEIVQSLGLSLDLTRTLTEIFANLRRGYSRDYAASRGEYLNGLILAEYLGFPFVDAAEGVCFAADGEFLPEATNTALQKRLAELPCAVIPGFYGARPDGTIQTFSRGGSDITGSLVARAVSADLYENWTDVSGFLLADPRIVDDPVSIGTITYQELHELARMGAGVLHEDAIYPVREAGIPIHIKNTNRPQDIGTQIVSSTDPKAGYEITGIAGKAGYCMLNLRKTLRGDNGDFNRKVLQVLRDKQVPCEAVPSGAGSVSVLVPQEKFLAREHGVLSGLHRAVQPDALSLESDLALVAIGGRGSRAKRDMAENVFAALEDAHIHIRTFDQSMEDLAMVIGVYDKDFEAAVRVIYHKFIRKDYGVEPKASNL